MGNNGKPWLNNSGVPDPTAHNAIKNVTAEEVKIDRAARLTINVIKGVLELAGFELVGRIQIKHKKSRKVFK
jgi:hypothetical protein